MLQMSGLSSRARGRGRVGGALLAMLVPAIIPLTSTLCHAQTGQMAPQRGGFTLLLSLGVGIQKDQAFDKSETGLAGLNLGIGGFLNEDLALMFRVSGTSADYASSSASLSQISGVGGAAVQYWLNDRFNLEGGAGVGFWDIEGTQDSSFGLILGTGFVFFNRGKHNLQLGVEYAPAFTDPETVHNVGVVLGYQLL